jgi:hypothetical protein
MLRKWKRRSRTCTLGRRLCFGGWIGDGRQADAGGGAGRREGSTDEERVEVFLSIWEDAGPAQRARLMEIIRLRLDGATGSDGDDEMGYGMG